MICTNTQVFLCRRPFQKERIPTQGMAPASKELFLKILFLICRKKSLYTIMF